MIKSEQNGAGLKGEEKRTVTLVRPMKAPLTSDLMELPERTHHTTAVEIKRKRSMKKEYESLVRSERPEKAPEGSVLMPLDSNSLKIIVTINQN